MTTLVDTSVWVDHFRRSNPVLVNLILSDLVLIHPMVLLEIACGTPPAPRSATLADLGQLRLAQQAGLSDVMGFIEREQLYGLGCGLVDMTLLASTLITPGAKLWTLDKRLSGLADRFGVGHQVPLH